MSRSRFAGARRARLLAPLGIAGALLLLGAGRAPAADRFVAGQVGVARAPLASGDADRFTARARADAAALGLPAAVRATAARVTNRFRATSYVEVAGLGARGERVSLSRYGTDGRLVTAIGLGWRTPARPIPAASATERARAVARSAGMTVDGSPVLARTADSGFSLEWPRRVDGVQVPGDGVRVVLWADGTLHSVTMQERPLAAAPTARIEQAEAERRARAHLAGWLAPADRPAARITGAVLAWIAPNDMFAAARPDAPGPVLRLAWVVSVAADGTLSQRWRALEIHLDAGDGALLGGDILR